MRAANGAEGEIYFFYGELGRGLDCRVAAASAVDEPGGGAGV